jgi:hypothetical protein
VQGQEPLLRALGDAHQRVHEMKRGFFGRPARCDVPAIDPQRPGGSGAVQAYAMFRQTSDRERFQMGQQRLCRFGQFGVDYGHRHRTATHREVPGRIPLRAAFRRNPKSRFRPTSLL